MFILSFLLLKFMKHKYDSKMYTIVFWERKFALMIFKVTIDNFLNNAEFIMKKR